MSARAPDAPASYTKPDAPYCMSGYSYSRKHTCDEWEIRSYLAEIDDYVSKLKEYATEAAGFADKAATFANDAVGYANCEKDDVMSEIE